MADYIARGKPAYRLDPLVLAADGPQAAIDWLAKQDLSDAPLLYASAEPAAVRAAQDKLGTARAGEIVEQAMAELAVSARVLGCSRFVVAGGETSGSVTWALAVTRLDVSREIAPGVPWCFAKSEGEQIAITLKSGNFGAENFFHRALGTLDRMEAA